MIKAHKTIEREKKKGPENLEATNIRIERIENMGLWNWPWRAGPSGFGSSSTAEEVTEGIDASHLTVIVTGSCISYMFQSIDIQLLQFSFVSVISVSN